jgi:predicted GNAT family acetyltransferase
VMAQRLYELADLHGPRQLSKGFPRLVTLEEVDLATKWLVGFAEEAGEPEAFDDARSVVTHRVAGGGLWFWDVGEPVALAGRRDPVAGAVRIGPVYTPKDHRRHGYATALTHALSERARDDGHRCLLYTDLNYPTSNSIYRALGYRAVAEVLRYQFEVPE